MNVPAPKRPRASASTGYTEWLLRHQTPRWKRIIDVQRPYRNHLRSLDPGFLLEIGCGIGRNLGHVGGRGVGVDRDAESVRYVRDVLGFEAYTPDEFEASVHANGTSFDTLLVAHVLEHMSHAEALALLRTYLPRIRPGGRVIVITPQEWGQARDPTHVRFVDHRENQALARDLGLTLEKQYSFPLPRVFGRLFAYNEFISLLRVPLG